MEKVISWGIIGVGDVCEVKSGPAFNKIEGSKLTAVMRRSASLAKEYAERHNVPKSYLIIVAPARRNYVKIKYKRETIVRIARFKI